MELDARTAELLASLRVCTGRALATASCHGLASSNVERVEAEGWSPPADGHLQLVWTLRLHERARDLGALRIEDSDTTSDVEQTDVLIRPPPGVELRRAGDPTSTVGPSLSFAWNERRRAAGPRVIVAEWGNVEAGGLRRFLLVLLLTAALGLLWLWVRRGDVAKLR